MLPLPKVYAPYSKFENPLLRICHF